MKWEDDAANKSFAKLLNEHFPVLLDEYLKDTPFCFSNKLTIADLAIAPVLTFLKCRKKFWETVPEKVKDYHTRVFDVFPGAKENVDMLDGISVGCFGEGADLEL